MCHHDMIKKISAKDKETAVDFALRGEYYGYPHCCSLEFAVAIQTRTGSRQPEQQGMGLVTGFVPCFKHSKDILAGRITIDSLISNRIHPLPFPMDDDDDPVVEWAEDKMKGLDINAYYDLIVKNYNNSLITTNEEK